MEQIIGDFEMRDDIVKVVISHIVLIFIRHVLEIGWFDVNMVMAVSVNTYKI